MTTYPGDSPPSDPPPSDPPASRPDAALAGVAAMVGVGLMVAAVWAVASAAAVAARSADPLAAATVETSRLAWAVRLAGVGAGAAAQAVFLTAVASVLGRTGANDAARLLSAVLCGLAWLAAVALYLASA